jgi:hypothetical protein
MRGLPANSQTTIECRYWPHTKPVPKGWRRTNALQGTHHGVYADIIVKDERMDRCRGCGMPLEVHEVHGHTQCVSCGQPDMSCCGDI